MDRPLRVIVIEDVQDDAELVLNELRLGGYTADARVVATEAGLRDVLREGPWDIVISDHSLPGFSASAALRVLQETSVDLPLIVVSGSIGEDAAVALMKAGAQDYLFKGNLARLAATVERELREAEVRQQRRQADRELHAQREFLRAIIDADPSLIFVKDRDGRFTLANEAVARIYGTTADELIGRSDADFNPDPAEVNGFRQDDLAVLESGRPKLIAEEQVTDRTTGQVRWFQTVKVPIEDPRGGRFVLGVASEITRRLAAEAESRQLDERLALIAHASNEVVYEHDLRSDAIWWNENLYDAFGIAPDAPVGHADWYLAQLHPEDTDVVLQALEQVRSDRTSAYQIEYRFRRGDDTWSYVLDRGSVLRAPDGMPERVVGAILDISSQKELEEQFRHAQRMEAIGRLAGGIAHDFNNLLTVIRGTTDLLIDTFEQGSTVRKDLGDIAAAADRATALTRDLLTFSRRQVVQPRVLDVNQVVEGIQSMLGRLLPETITLRLRLADGLDRIRADAGQLDQVIMNLVVNARDAMPSGGALTLETDNVELDDEYASVHRDVVPGEHVMLAVSDDGHGMSPAVRERLFEPFFTTKGVGEGTGLGLATVYGIVRQSGGHIWVYTEPDRGTTFKLYFPRVEKTSAEVTGAPAAALPDARGGETILAVEDDAAVRAVTCRMLRQRGYNVLEADSGTAAVKVAERHLGRIDLLFTDVVMPGMDGRQLYEEVRRRYPGIRVIFTSGYTGDGIQQSGVLEFTMPYLQKPFTPTALSRLVRQVLDEIDA